MISLENYLPDLVSVIIPTYNRSGLLKEAIESIFNQTYRPIECIVVDDGSVDDTKGCVESFDSVAIDTFALKYIYQINGGSQIARNTGTKACKGEFIQYLDSDDLLYPEKIQKQVDYLKTNVDCDGVFGDWQKGNVHHKELIEAFESKDLISQFLTRKAIVNFSFLMRRRIISKIGEWDENVKRNQEIDFQLRGLLEEGVYKYQPQICGLWRIHKETRIANTTGYKEVLYFFEKWEKLLEHKNLLNNKMKENMANVLFWTAIKGTEKPDKQRTHLLLAAIRLDKNISFYNTPKMKLIVGWVGKKIALKLWVLWYQRHLK